jgi:hypothetical protein
MGMLELVNTSATVATLVVLASAAVAAMIQLSHMRAANQLAAFMAINASGQTPAMLDLLDFTYQKLPSLIQSGPEYVQRFAEGTVPLKDSPLLLGFWFDQIGTVLRQKLVSPDVIFQGTGAYALLRCWQLMYPLIEATRTRAPSAFLHFEYAAVRAKLWLAAHPKGNYPKGVPRWSQLTPDSASHVRMP